MKLETIFAISMALAIPSAITAQNDSVENERGTASLTFGIDESGIDFAVTGGYADGTTVLLVSLGQTDEGNGLQRVKASWVKSYAEKYLEHSIIDRVLFEVK